MTAFVPLLLATALLGSGGDADSEAPTIQHTPVEKAFLRRELKIKADIADASGVFQPMMYYRRVGEPKFTPVELKSEDGLSHLAAIPGSFVTDDVEYYIEAYDNSGNGPAQVGKPEAPLRVATEEPPAPPPVDAPLNVGALATGGVGVVAAIAGAALYLIAAGQVATIDAKYAPGATRTASDAKATLAAQGLGQTGSIVSGVGAVVAVGGLVWFLIPTGGADEGDGGGGGLTLGVSGRF